VTPHRNDQVFQLSLTEIAFTIAFLLLLLVGYRVWQEQAAHAAATAALAQAQQTQREAQSMAHARDELARALREAGVADVDAAISKLVEAGELRAERDRLRRQVDDLDAKLSALAPARPAPEGLGASDGANGVIGANGTDASADAARAALGLASAARPARETAPAAAARLEKENADLRGQLAYVSNRLGTATGRGGRDFPPCWADADGRVEFLFAIETRPGEVVVTPAWPPRRDAAARALPGIAELTAAPLSNAQFLRAVQGLFDWSRAQDPECRHYVELRSTIADAVQSDRARLMVERFFYKSEVPR
jgi:hypothetical protein